MDADETEILRRYAKTVAFIAHQRDVENEARMKRQRGEAELRDLKYTLRGISATRLVSDVLFLVLGNLSDGEDMRSFRLTCTHWNQSFLDNLAAFTNAGQLWDVSRSVHSFKTNSHADNPSAAFLFHCGMWRDYDRFIGKYSTSGIIQCVVDPIHYLAIKPTTEGLWTRRSPASFVIYFRDGSRFVYSQTVDSTTVVYLNVEHNKKVSVQYYSPVQPVNLTAQWEGAQADLTWNTVIQDITDLIRGHQPRFTRDLPKSQLINRPLREAVEHWRRVVNAGRTS